MKKRWILAMSILILGVVLAACGGKNEKSSNNAKDEGTITIWATNINVPVLEQAAELYKKAHPDFKLKVTEMANDDIRTKMTTGLQAGGKGLPDAALLVDDGITGYIENFPKAFVNLSEKGFDEIKGDFPQYKIDSVSKDGSVYAFPFDAGPVAVFYRKDVFEQAGIDPSKINTWDDYIEAGKVIKEKTGMNMLSYDSNDSTVYTILLSQQGVGYFSKDGKSQLASKESKNTASIFQKMSQEKIILGVSGWDAWVTTLSSNQTATAITGAWLEGTLEQQVPDQAGKWSVMNLPAFEEGGSRSANQGGSSFAISSSSSHIDETYEFLKFFATSFESQEIAMKGGLFPSYLPVYESDLFSQPVEYMGNEPIWSFFANEMEKIPSVFYTENDSIARDEAIKVQSEVTNGTAVDDSIKDANARVENRTK